MVKRKMATITCWFEWSNATKCAGAYNLCHSCAIMYTTSFGGIPHNWQNWQMALSLLVQYPKWERITHAHEFQWFGTIGGCRNGSGILHIEWRRRIVVMLLLQLNLCCLPKVWVMPLSTCVEHTYKVCTGQATSNSSLTFFSPKFKAGRSEKMTTYPLHVG
jgi:hypothetical protein